MKNFLNAEVYISIQNYNEATAKQIASSFRDLLRKNNYTCKVSFEDDNIVIKVKAEPNSHSREEFVELVRNFALGQEIKIDFDIEAHFLAEVVVEIWNNDNEKYKINYEEKELFY